MSNEITFKDFIKKYWTINNDFIDDFYSIFENYNNNKICINIDIITKWLNTVKKNTIELIITHFTENVHYVYNKNINLNNKITMFISPRCFKQYCMMTTTEKSK